MAKRRTVPGPTSTAAKRANAFPLNLASCLHPDWPRTVDGYAAFVAACRAYVAEHGIDWHEFRERLGRRIASASSPDSG